MIKQGLSLPAKTQALDARKILVPVDFALAPHNVATTGRIVGSTPKNIAARLAWHPFFVATNPALLQALTNCATVLQFEPGETIVKEGEVADGFYLIESGKVTVESASEITNPTFAWSWMFPPHLWAFTARAAEPTTAIFLYGPLLRECCESNHSLGYELLKRMSFLTHQQMQAAQNGRLHEHRQVPKAVALQAS